MKKVLIALDYDPTSQKIAEIGYAMASAMEAQVVLVHVLLDLAYYSMTYMNMGPLLLDTIVELKDASQDFLNKTKSKLGDESIITIVKEGDFAESILETAKETQADFIVMGSHSRKWLENILMGSVAEEVLRKTKIPLLLIPTRKQ